VAENADRSFDSTNRRGGHSARQLLRGRHRQLRPEGGRPRTRVGSSGL